MTSPEKIINEMMKVWHGDDGVSATDGIRVREALNDAGYVIVPKEATHDMIVAALNSAAPPPDELPRLFDILDFSGENHARRAVRAAYAAMIAASQNAGPND